MTETMRQNGISALLVILSTIVVLLLSPKIVYEPRGIISPLVEVTAPSPVDEVVAYRFSPMGARPVGFFSVEFFAGEDQIKAQEDMVEYAKKLAAQVGANGVVVEQFSSGGDMWYLTGKAITVKKGG